MTRNLLERALVAGLDLRNGGVRVRGLETVDQERATIRREVGAERPGRERDRARKSGDRLRGREVERHGDELRPERLAAPEQDEVGDLDVGDDDVPQDDREISQHGPRTADAWPVWPVDTRVERDRAAEDGSQHHMACRHVVYEQDPDDPDRDAQKRVREEALQRAHHRLAEYPAVAGGAARTDSM
jgi:hypothetical protein